MNQREANIALFAFIVGIVNIFLLIFHANIWVLSAFSFALSIAVFYFAWRELEVLDVVKNIRNVILMSWMEKDVNKAIKESMEELQNAKNPFEK